MGGEDAPASSGDTPVLRPTESGPALDWRGVAFYPGRDPQEYARRKARSSSPLPRTLCVVPSVGLGYGLRELLAALPEGCAILCIEAFQEIMAVAVRQDLPSDPRLLIVRTAEMRGVDAALHRLGAHRFRRVMQVPLSAGYRLAPDLYESFLSVLTEGVRRSWQNRMTLIAMGSLQVRNLLSNLPALRHAADFSSLACGMPVVVTGAGPSLDESLPLLRRLRHRFVLCAVDTALPTLRAAGLRPELVVALEAQAANLQDFVGTAGGDTWLACDLCSHPTGVRLFAGRTVFFSSAFAPLSLFDRLSAEGLLPFCFPPLGSVGVAAVHAALLMTESDVFLTGLDFSYPGSRTHARGTPGHLAMLARAGRCRPVGQDSFAALAARPLIAAAGKRGGSVRTDSLLRSYRDSLENEISGAPGRVADMGREGLPLGAALIDGRELEERLGAGDRGAPLARDPARGFPTGRVEGLIAAERELLRRAGSMLGGAPGAAAAPGLEGVLRQIDYAWAHFPEYPDMPGDTPGFRARVRVAAGYYEQRLARILSVL